MLDKALALLLVPLAVIDMLFPGKPEFTVEQAEINGKAFRLYIARSEQALRYGFKGKKVEEDEAMLFVFEKDGIKTFWMRGTKSELDIVFMSDSFVVRKVVKRAKPCRLFCKLYYGRARYVLELKGGVAEKLDIEEEKRVKIKFIS